MTVAKIVERPKLKLTGQDGNAFMILGLARRAAIKANWPTVRIDAVLTEMKSGNYDHQLATAMEHFDVR